MPADDQKSKSSQDDLLQDSNNQNQTPPPSVDPSNANTTTPTDDTKVDPNADDAQSTLEDLLNGSQANLTKPQIITTEITEPASTDKQSESPSGGNSNSTHVPKKYGGTKVIASIFSVLFIVGAVVAGVNLVQQQQDLREEAATVFGPNPTKLPQMTEVTQAHPDAHSEGGIKIKGSAEGWQVIFNPTNKDVYGRTVNDCVAHENPPGTCRPNQDNPYVSWKLAPNKGIRVSIDKECYLGQIDSYWGPSPIDGKAPQDQLNPGYPYGTGVQVPKGSSSCSVTNTKTPTPSVTSTPTPSKTGTPTPSKTGTPTPSVTSTLTPTATITVTLPPEITAKCNNVKAYDEDNNLLTQAQLSELSAGDTVRFAVSGQANSGTFTKARFSVNNVSQGETTTKNPNGEFYIEYTIPAGTTNFSVKGEINHSSLGWI